MLQSDEIRNRPFEDKPTHAGGFDFSRLAEEEARDRADRRRLFRLIVLAAAIHVVLLLVHLPQMVDEPREASSRNQKVFVVQQVRFRPPPPKAQQEIPKRKVKRIPIPDPTPNDPEPIRVEDEISLDVDLPPTDELFIGIPEGPPSTGPTGVLEVGGDVRAPVKEYAPQPIYTEEARAARVQGVVILRAIIDERGNVVDVQVIKGLPAGMSDQTVETVKTWKFKPGTRDGQPVPVYFNFTVNFSLQ